MFCRNNPAHVPSMAEMGDYIRTPVWSDFCRYLDQKYHARPLPAFSKCSWEYGWNIKFKKGGKALCTVYPRENFFTVMLVVGRKEKERFERDLALFCREIQEIYLQTKEGSGQKWLMIDLEEGGRKYEDVKRLLEIRAF